MDVELDNDYVLSTWSGQVHKQLTRYRSITWQSLLDGEITLLRNRDNGIRVTIVNGSVFFKVIPTSDEGLHASLRQSRHTQSIFEYTLTIMVSLKMLLNAYPIKNAAFNMRFGDGCHDLDVHSLDSAQTMSSLSMAPLFSYTHASSGNKACSDVTLPSFDWVFPSQQFLPGSPYRMDRHPQVPWNLRKDILLFRGNLNSWDGSRIHLLLASILHPDLIDAKLSDIEDEQCHRIIKVAAEQSPPIAISNDCRQVIGDYKTSEETLEYKYIIDVDGHGATFRHKNTMLGSFVMFKIDSEYEQFYFSSLEPWTHYIPVSRTNMAASIAQRVAWARAHDDECQKIAQRSYEFAKNYLTSDKMQWYQAEVLNQYAEKLDFEPMPEEGSHEFCCSQLESAEAPHLVDSLIPHCYDVVECDQDKQHEYFKP